MHGKFWQKVVLLPTLPTQSISTPAPLSNFREGGGETRVPLSVYHLVYFIAGVSLVFFVHFQWGGAQWDFQAYLEAARTIQRGENPYTTPDELKAHAMTKLTVYVYPPLFARIFSYFMFIPSLYLGLMWFLTQCIALEAVYWLGLCLFEKKFERVTWLGFHAIVLLYDGVLTDLRAGNTALMETAVLTGWAWLHWTRPLLAGLLLGTLISIKPLVAFNALWDLVRSRWLAFLSVSGVAGSLYLVMFLDCDLFASYQVFLNSRTFQKIMDEHTVGIFNNATVSVGFRLFTDQTMFKPILLCSPLAYTFTFAVPVIAWLMTFSVWGKMAEANGQGGVPLSLQNQCGFLLLLPTVLLTIPRVADYTLVWLVVPFFFGTWLANDHHAWSAFLLYILAGVIGNLPVHPGGLVELTYSYHLLHYRYVSLLLFWGAGWVLCSRICRLYQTQPAMFEPTLSAEPGSDSLSNLNKGLLLSSPPAPVT